MKTRILMVGKDKRFLEICSRRLVKEHFDPVICMRREQLASLIPQSCPEVIFFNFCQADSEAMDLYHSVLDDLRFAGIPVVFTLSENDVYIVNKKRTAFREQRSFIASSLTEAFRICMAPAVPTARKRISLRGSVPAEAAAASRA